MKVIQNPTEKELKAQFKGKDLVLSPGENLLREEEANFVKGLWGFLGDLGEREVVQSVAPDMYVAPEQEELPVPQEEKAEPIVEAPRRGRKKKLT